MPAGASGRLPVCGTRQTPAWDAAKTSRWLAAPEKNVRCCGPAAARPAKSNTSNAPSAPANAMLVFSQIRARVKGPRLLKKRGSAMGGSRRLRALFLRRSRRRRVEIDFEGGHFLVQPVDGVAGNVKAGGIGEHHRLLVQHQIGAAFLDQLLQDG